MELFPRVSAAIFIYLVYALDGCCSPSVSVAETASSYQVTLCNTSCLETSRFRMNHETVKGSFGWKEKWKKNTE